MITSGMMAESNQGGIASYDIDNLPAGFRKRKRHGYTKHETGADGLLRCAGEKMEYYVVQFDFVPRGKKVSGTRTDADAQNLKASHAAGVQQPRRQSI